MSTATSNPPPKLRRRWFRYSLRTLLLLVVVACVWLGIVVNRVRRQRETVAALQKARCGTILAYQLDESDAIIPDATPPEPQWLHELFGDYDCVSVNLSDNAIRDELVPHLANLSRLKSLTIDTISSSISDDELDIISRIRSLEGLSLRGTAGKITRWHYLTRLKDLRYLDLFSSNIDDDGLAQLKSLAHLQCLVIANADITDAGVAHLADLSRLELLQLSGTPITDAAIPYLERLPLRRVALNGTRVTVEGVKRLKRALPECEIWE